MTTILNTAAPQEDTMPAAIAAHRSNCRYCNRSFKFESSRQRHEQIDCTERPAKPKPPQTFDTYLRSGGWPKEKA